MAFNNNNVEWFSMRGGKFRNEYTTCPASHRVCMAASFAGAHCGSYTVLYVK